MTPQSCYFYFYWEISLPWHKDWNVNYSAINSHESQLILATQNQENLAHCSMIKHLLYEREFLTTYGSYVLSHRESRRQSINDPESWPHHYCEPFSSSSLHPHSEKAKNCSVLGFYPYLLPSTRNWRTSSISADTQDHHPFDKFASCQTVFCHGPWHLNHMFDDNTKGLLTQLCW